MNLLVPIGVGVVLGILLGVIPGILGLIPFVGGLISVCICFLAPAITVVGGYVASMIGKQKKDDWMGMAVSMAVLSLTSTVISSITSVLLAMFNVGSSALSGDAKATFFSAGLSILAIVIGSAISFITTFILAALGAAIYMFTSAEK